MVIQYFMTFSVRMQAIWMKNKFVHYSSSVGYAIKFLAYLISKYWSVCVQIDVSQTPGICYTKGRLVYAWMLSVLAS
jgi:hypothetical protein